MLFLALLAVCAVNKVQAQANRYTFAASAGTYTAITGGTVLNTTIPDSWVSGSVSLSPGFNFAGTIYTTAFITSNGLITLGASAPSTTNYNAISSSTGSGFALCPFNADLDASKATGATPEIRFQTVGNEHVFQWTDASRYNAGDRFNIQVRLNTSTGQIAYIYGGSMVVGNGTNYQPVVGICTATDYLNTSVSTGTETWAAPLMGTSTTSSMRFTTSTTSPKIPVVGQTYTFTPPTCYAPSSAPVSLVTINSATLNWTASTPAPAGGYEIYYSTAATAPTAATTPLALTTGLSQPVSGLSFNTPYYAWVRSACSGTDKSNWIALPNFTTLIACNAPTALSIGAVTSTAAVLNFTGTSAAYIAEYGPVGFTPGTGATAGTGGTLITGSGSSILLTGLTALTYYDVYLRGNCTGLGFGYSTNSVKLNFVTNGCVPASVVTTPGARCGVGTVNLAATTSGATLKWYTAATGGTSIGTGSPFTTPVISATTDFYVGAENTAPAIIPVGAGASTGTSTSYNPFNGTYGGFKGQYLFTAAELLSAGLLPGNISSIGFDITTAGATDTAFSIQIGTTALTAFATPVSIQGGLTTAYTSTFFKPVVGINTFTLSTPFNWDGISNIIVSTSWSNGNSSNTSSGVKYDATTNYASQCYQKDNETAANMLAFTGAPTLGTSSRSLNRPKMIFNGQALCSSVRTAVTATVNTAPVLSVSPNQTVCNNAVTPLSVTSPIANYNTYIWSPSANLFTDAAATIPYTGTSATTVYFKSATPGQAVFTITGNNTVTSCAQVASDTIVVLPASAVVTATPSSNCMSGSAVLTLAPATGYGNGTLQWQSSPTNSGFADMSGVTGTSYTTSVLTSSMYYRVIVKNSAGAICITTVSDTALIYNPAITGTTPGVRCGPGTVVLSAATSDGTPKWYTAATGGLSVATGPSFTTPSLTATTSYYVSAASGSGSGIAVNGAGAVTSISGSGGSYEGTSPYAYHYGNYKHQMLVKATDLLAAGAGAGTLTSLAFDVASVGTATFNNFNVSLKMTTAAALTATFETGTTDVYTAASVTPVVGINTYNFTAPFVWDGISNIIVQVCWNNNNSGSVANSAEVKYDVTSYISHNIFRADNTQNTICATLAGNVSNDGPITSKLPKMLFGYTSGCESARTLVTATINPKPDTTVTVTGATTFCPGKSATLTAATATGVTYQWLLNNNVISGATSAAYTAATAGSYRVKVSNATCTDTSAARVITILPAPTATVTTVGATTFCTGGSVTFNGPAPVTGTTYQWQRNNADIVSATTASYTATAAGNYRLVMSNGSCADTSANITVTVNVRPTATVTAAGAASFCTGGSVVLNATTGTGYTYQWQRNLANIAGATNASYTAGLAGNYRLVVSSGLCSDTSAALTVTLLATPVSTVTTSGATTVCQGNRVVLNGPAPVTGVTYQWQRNNANITGATGNTYAATTTGSYRLVLSNGACGDTSAAVAVTVNPLPVATATAGGPVAFCAPGSVLLTANTATGVTYRWLKDNIAITPAATAITYSATTTGSYRVVVTNTATGCADTSLPAIAVNVSALPATTLTFSGSLTFCQGGSTVLQAATGTGYTYTWYKDGAIVPGATASGYTATTSGAYNAVVVSGTCTATSISRTVVVNPLPAAVATALGNTNFCLGGSVVLSASTGTGYTYIWRRDGIAVGTGATYTATLAGTYDVIINNGTCQNTSNAIVIIISTPPAPQITVTGTNSFCQGGTVQLSVAASPAYTYQWNLNGAPIAGATTPVYTAGVAGNYTATVTSGTCIVTSPVTAITVNPLPAAVVLPQGATTFCDGSAVVLFASLGTGYTYQWLLNGAPVSGATGASYIATNSGDYSAIISNGLCADTARPVTVEVVARTTPVITVQNTKELSTGNYAAYQWYRNGVAIPGATGKTYTAVRDGDYTVTVVILAGCTSTSAVQSISSLAVPGVAQLQVKVYPNPASETIHIDAAKQVNIAITSIDGKSVLTKENAVDVDIRNLADGVYIIRISNETGQLIKTERLVKTTR